MHFETRSRRMRVGLELRAHDIREFHALAFGATDQPLHATERAQPFEETIQR